MYEIADLANVSGAPVRSVTWWADRGCLVADPGTEKGGQGTHRTFGRDEMIVSAILGAFYLDAAPISRLESVALTVRGLLANRDTRRDIEDAIEGRGKSFLIFDQMPSPLFFAGISKADGTRDYSGIVSYLLEEMTERNRKSNVVALHACLATLRSYVPGGRTSRAHGAKR